MAVSGQILIYPTSRRGFFPVVLAFTTLLLMTDTKLKTIVAITNYTLFQPSDHKLVNNAYQYRSPRKIVR